MQQEPNQHATWDMRELERELVPIDESWEQELEPIDETDNTDTDEHIAAVAAELQV